MNEQTIVLIVASAAALFIAAVYGFRKWQMTASERRDDAEAKHQAEAILGKYQIEASIHSHEEPPMRRARVRQIKQNIRMRKRKGRK